MSLSPMKYGNNGSLDLSTYALSLQYSTRVSMEVIVTSDRKLGVITYLRDLQPTFIGVVIHLLSTRDIPVTISHERYTNQVRSTSRSDDFGSHNTKKSLRFWPTNNIRKANQIRKHCWRSSPEAWWSVPCSHFLPFCQAWVSPSTPRLQGLWGSCLQISKHHWPSVKLHLIPAPFLENLLFRFPILSLFSKVHHDYLDPPPGRRRHTVSTQCMHPQTLEARWFSMRHLYWDVLLVLRINGLFHPYKGRLDTCCK